MTATREKTIARVAALSSEIEDLRRKIDATLKRSAQLGFSVQYTKRIAYLPGDPIPDAGPF